jgi:hypothetical protein
VRFARPDSARNGAVSRGGQYGHDVCSGLKRQVGFEFAGVHRFHISEYERGPNLGGRTATAPRNGQK